MNEQELINNVDTQATRVRFMFDPVTGAGDPTIQAAWSVFNDGISQRIADVNEHLPTTSRRYIDLTPDEFKTPIPLVILLQEAVRKAAAQQRFVTAGELSVGMRVRISSDTTTLQEIGDARLITGMEGTITHHDAGSTMGWQVRFDDPVIGPYRFRTTDLQPVVEAPTTDEPVEFEIGDRITVIPLLYERFAAGGFPQALIEAYEEDTPLHGEVIDVWQENGQINSVDVELDNDRGAWSFDPDMLVHEQ